MGNHEQLLQNYPYGTYADFVEKQKSSEQEGPAKETSLTGNNYQTNAGDAATAAKSSPDKLL